jgi:hypothetical protein
MVSFALEADGEGRLIFGEEESAPLGDEARLDAVVHAGPGRERLRVRRDADEARVVAVLPGVALQRRRGGGRGCGQRSG